MNNSLLDNLAGTVEDLKRENERLIKKIKEISNNLSVEDFAFCASMLGDSYSSFCPSDANTNNYHLKVLIKDISDFIKSLSDVSSIVSSPENYLLICDMAIRWEQRLSSFFNVSRIIDIAKAPVDVLPVLAAGDALGEDELEKRLKSLAKVIYAYRLRLLHRDDSNEKEDWHKAEVFLALDILDGTINFSRRISSASYYRLENIWLAEVRELIAYLDWERNGCVLGDPHTLYHYKKAWNDLKDRLLDRKIKSGINEFGEAKRYLENKYVTKQGEYYKIDREKIDKAGDANIIKIKSAKIHEVTSGWDINRNWDHQLNWIDAENYVKLYYENIIPAVMGNSESAQKVIDAFDYSMRNTNGDIYKGARRIINAFEMTLAVYFISTETLSRVSIPLE